MGVNLLREGLDLPEVSLVAILDADKEGFLRSETSLIQTIGRAARNVNAKVILYADKITDSMRVAIDETNRRRATAGGVQQAARHHARDDSQEYPGGDRVGRGRSPSGQCRRRTGRGRAVHHRRVHERAGSRDDGSGRAAGIRDGRPRFATASCSCKDMSARSSARSKSSRTNHAAAARRKPHPKSPAREGKSERVMG